MRTTNTVDTIEFEKALARFHEAIWEAAQEDSRVDYDLAGVGVAKQLIELYVKAHTANMHAKLVGMATPEALELLGQGEQTWVEPPHFGEDDSIPLYTIGELHL